MKKERIFIKRYGKTGVYSFLQDFFGWSIFELEDGNNYFLEYVAEAYNPDIRLQDNDLDSLKYKIRDNPKYNHSS